MFDTRLWVHILFPLPTSQPNLPTKSPILLVLPLLVFSILLSSTLSSTLFPPPPLKVVSCNRFLSLFFTLTRKEMAQKTEKEETELKFPETITPCVNNCGLTGNPATNNMCQNCFNATTTTVTTNTVISQQQQLPPSSRFPEEKVVVTVRSATSARSPKRSHPSDEEEQRDPATVTGRGEMTSSEAKRVVNRCSGCRRRVGLTGFRCRCGDLFCAEHRYSDRHECTYDYKAAGREAIARGNPVVKAAKIVKV